MHGTPRTLLAAIVTGSLLLGAAVARGQLSPGPLARPHASLDRTGACLECHVRSGGAAAMDRRCLDCHREIERMRTTNRGFHARVREKNCASCHPDHGGREFDLISWEGGRPEAFDHSRAGYALAASHAKLECRACHQTKHQSSAVVPLIQMKDHAKSWLGLETACAACHEDPHRKELGAECARCHDESKWSAAPRFDHAQAKYPLTGKHAKVECAACHEAASLRLERDAKGAVIPRYRPLPHGECSACHTDPHRGRFGAGCATCHSTVGFAAIREAGFDHDRTRYPLRDKHATLACAACHDPRLAWGKKPAFARCDNCHRDAHAGQATIRGVAADCASCHAVTGFHPSTFALSAHQQSAYPLEGAHVKASCERCHGKRPAVEAAALGSARVVMRPAHRFCTDCHFDPHQGKLGAAKVAAAACTECHDIARFRPSRYDVADHASSGFALEGAHRAVPCAACHADLRRPPAASTLRTATATQTLTFESKARACAECHKDPHAGQFAARKKGAACELCHGIEAFAPASRFDHDRDTAFKLQGAHARTPCASCHAPKRGPDGVLRVLYRPTPTRCESCHSDLRGTGGDRRTGSSMNRYDSSPDARS